NINDARGACIAQPQSSLQKRSGRAFFLTNDLETFFHQLFVFVRYFFGRTGGRLEFFMHRWIESRMTLRRNKFYQAPNFLIGYQNTLRSNQSRRAWRQVEHISLASQTIVAVFIENHATIAFARHWKRNPARNASFDHIGDYVSAC